MSEPATNDQIRADVRAIRLEYPDRTIPVVELSNLALRAADTIEQQQGEIEEATAAAGYAEHQNGLLQAEIERLREALEKIGNMTLAVDRGTISFKLAHWAKQTARAALGKGE